MTRQGDGHQQERTEPNVVPYNANMLDSETQAGNTGGPASSLKYPTAVRTDQGTHKGNNFERTNGSTGSDAALQLSGEPIANGDIPHRSPPLAKEREFQNPWSGSLAVLEPSASTSAALLIEHGIEVTLRPRPSSMARR